MAYIIRIKRQEGKDDVAYWQDFEYDGNKDVSIATVLNELNSRNPLKDNKGKEAEAISWECGCMVRKCGACAMRINGLPRLACATFLSALKGNKVILEPLSKFPLVKDLVVDRSVVFENLKKINLWLESEAYMIKTTHKLRYQSAKCLLCGCCLEVCPNFCVSSRFVGAIAPVNVFRILDEEQNTEQKNKISDLYKSLYYEGCGKSLSCHDICPVGIPVEELMVNSNATAIWKR